MKNTTIGIVATVIIVLFAWQNTVIKEDKEITLLGVSSGDFQARVVQVVRKNGFPLIWNTKIAISEDLKGNVPEDVLEKKNGILARHQSEEVKIEWGRLFLDILMLIAILSLSLIATSSLFRALGNANRV